MHLVPLMYTYPFLSTDGAIDTLVINVDCLDTESIQSLEVTYYEDLLGFPPDECAGNSSKPNAAAAAAASSPPTKSKSKRGGGQHQYDQAVDKENMALVPFNR